MSNSGIQYFPQVAPANSVIGRLGLGPGPTEAIPLTTLAAYLNTPMLTPEQFGAVGDGVTDDSGAIGEAVTYLGSKGGGALVFSAKKYAQSQNLLVTSGNIAILGQGKNATQFVPLSNNMFSIQLKSNWNRISGIGFQNLNGVTNCAAILLGTNSASEVVTVNENYIEDVLYYGYTHGRFMAPGADGSQVYKNIGVAEHSHNCNHGLVFYNPTASGSGGANANDTYSFSAENDGGHCNGGIIILAGVRNTFYGGYHEGIIDSGDASDLLTTPAGIYIAEQSSDGFANAGNSFHGVKGEGNTKGIILNAAGTYFSGCDLGGDNDFNVNPASFDSGDLSQLPAVSAAMLIEGNSQLIGPFANDVSIAIGSAGFAAQPGGTGPVLFYETLAGRQWMPQIGTSGVAINSAWPYVANAVYRFRVGAADVAGTQVGGNSGGEYCEGPSGTFTAQDTPFTTTAGSIGTYTVVFARSGGNITATITAVKSGIVFATYANVERLR